MTSTHVQRVVELSSPELSIMWKVPKQKYVEVLPIPFHNDYPVNYQLDNTGKFLVSINDTVQLDFQLNFILILTT